MFFPKKCKFTKSMFYSDCNNLLIEWRVIGLQAQGSEAEALTPPRLGVPEACLVTACQGYLLLIILAFAICPICRSTSFRYMDYVDVFTAANLFWTR